MLNISLFREYLYFISCALVSFANSGGPKWSWVGGEKFNDSDFVYFAASFWWRHCVLLGGLNAMRHFYWFCWLSWSCKRVCLGPKSVNGVPRQLIQIFYGGINSTLSVMMETEVVLVKVSSAFLAYQKSEIKSVYNINYNEKDLKINFSLRGSEYGLKKQHF